MIQSGWPVLLAACGLGALVFLRVAARVRQEQVERYEVQRQAAIMMVEYRQRQRERTQRASGSASAPAPASGGGGYEVVR